MVKLSKPEVLVLHLRIKIFKIIFVQKYVSGVDFSFIDRNEAVRLFLIFTFTPSYKKYGICTVRAIKNGFYAEGGFSIIRIK